MCGGWCRPPQVWLWYVSVTLLAFMLGFLLLRFLAFLFFWVMGYEYWFLPNLFDESLSFVDSFKPVRRAAHHHHQGQHTD